MDAGIMRKLFVDNKRRYAPMTDQELVKKAFDMHQFSYVPYSRFPVGAALLTGDGRVFTG